MEILQFFTLKLAQIPAPNPDKTNERNQENP